MRGGLARHVLRFEGGVCSLLLFVVRKMRVGE
jgi:hypothetical protein